MMRKSFPVAVLNNLLFAALNEAKANQEEKIICLVDRA
jgi:hypothetical protein